MNIFSRIRHNHSGIFRILITTLSLGLIVLVFPKNPQFRYEYKNLQGKPWPYESLIAEFDFAIKKSAEELKTEQAEILKSFHPYYKFSEESANSVLTSFEKKYSVGLDKNDYLMGKKLLDSLYTRGIIRLDENIEGKDKNYIINLLRKNVASEYVLSDFFTVQSAKEFIGKKLDEYASLNRNTLIGYLEASIEQNVIYDEETSAKILKQSLDGISPTRDMVLKNQIVISKGELLTQDKFQMLESLSSEYEIQSRSANESYLYLVGGQLAITGFCLSILILFLYLFRYDVYSDNTRFFFILFNIVLLALTTGLLHDFREVNSFIIPFCIVPVIIRAFYDTRIALFVHLVMVMIISFMVQRNFEFLFIQLTSGIMAIFSIANLRNRSQVFLTSMVVFLSSLFCFVSIRMVQDNGLQNISWNDLETFFISAILTLFSFPLIFLFEKIFGFVSDVTLMELSSNTTLLRELASKAPGTFQHSLQVANLAEDVLYNIGGNALLARAGALHHDIGKMDMPAYFNENRSGNINPHEELNNEESAEIIISHVLKGIEKARQYKLPEPLIDFIRTHHGTTRAEYFYRHQKQDFPDQLLEEKKYRYPGPLPFSKETAVVMICDSVEAASRSMKDFSADSIGKLVDAMIDRLVNENQFINADITFKDITVIRKTLKKKLQNIYHGRIEYPAA